MDYSGIFLLKDQPGFTPHLSRLVGMMRYARLTTLRAVQGLTTEELDFPSTAGKNSIGALLAHIAAVELWYQVNTLGRDKADLDGQGAALDLGERGQKDLRGVPLGHYLEQLRSVRAWTLEAFQARDDAWLHKETDLWGQKGNNYFMWFHVFEDELNHRGQIRLIAQQLPGMRDTGWLGLMVEPAREDERGLRVGVASGPAQAAGLAVGDEILEFNGVDVTNCFTYTVDIRGSVGQPAEFLIRRDGVSEPLRVTTVRQPRPE